MPNSDRGRQTSHGRRGRQNRLSTVRAVLLCTLLAVVISTLLLIEFLPSNRLLLDVGDVSPAVILAPYDLTYESAIRTQQAQAAQAASVQDIYDPPDASVARQQEVRAQQILDYVSTVREDPYATVEQKTKWLAAIPDLDLSPAVIEQALTLNEGDWLEVEEETVRVLIGAMQGEIRDSQVAAVRRRLPTLINISMTDEQAEVIEAIAGGLVTANTFYNAARTEEARQQARANTEPVNVTIRKGEAIVRQGSLIRPLDIEALDAFGLHQQETDWQSVGGAVALAVVVTVLLALVISRLQPSLWARGRASIVTFLLIAIFVALGKLMLPVTSAGGVGTSAIPYLYPLPALAMILSTLFGPALGLAVGVMVALLGGYIAGGSLEITTYLMAGTVMAALSLGRAERLNSFLRAGLAVALTNAAVILLFGLLSPERDMLRVSINALVGVVSAGLATSLALAAFFILSAVLDVITPFQLIELSRPTHPLFRQLLLKASGTYHHTLMVANMAEEAAERIGADGLLTRVGTYYHDIGKTLRPYFFTENRVGNVNPHERLDPYTSAQIVISHVADGLELAKKYRLPSAVYAFIPEHHGTSMTLAFYRMAVSAAGDDGDSVREEDFRYPGPKPQSRETALTMLADSCEARVRSAEPKTVEEMERIIAETIKARLDDGQLDDSDLTLRDLQQAQAAFLSVLKGVFHPRVKYPEPVKIKRADGQEVRI
jgi:putative nucleotidyltransferase with HDIG domain